MQYPGLERRMKVDIMTMAFISKSVARVSIELSFISGNNLLLILLDFMINLIVA